MPLYIRDNEVDALAAELQLATGAATKTEAVRKALRNELERAREKEPLIERVKKIQERVRAIGPRDPNFDFRKFREEIWGEND